MKRTPQKHSQHPPPVTANENSPGANSWNQADPGWLYKQAQGSRVKQSSKRPRRDYFSGSSLLLSSKRPRRDYFSGSSLLLSSKRPRRNYFSGTSPRACKGPVPELLLQPQTRRGYTSVSATQAEPQGGAISLPQSGCHSVFNHPQSLPRSAHPDLVLEVGLQPPVADLTSRIPCEDQLDADLASRIPCEDQQDADNSTSRIRMRTCLLSSLRSQAGLLISRRNSLEFPNHTSTLTRLARGSDLLLGALRGQGHPHHPLLAAHESTRPPSGGGVSNGSMGYQEQCPPDP